MCSCPWHEDKHPSMKVFNDGANCFSCGWNGDIFSFVMRYDGVDFPTAFKSLGGTFDEITDEKEYKRQIDRIKRQKTAKERKKRYDEGIKKEISLAITICRRAAEIYKPTSMEEDFPEEWVYAENKLQWLLNVWNEKYIEEQEIDDFNVYRECRQIRQRFL